MNFAWSRVGLELVIDTPTIKQGEITTGKLIVKQAEGQSALTGLQGKNIAKTLYLLKVGPFMGKLGSLQSDVKIIFLTVPPTNAISDLTNNEEVFVVWNNVEVLPTEPAKTFLLGDFDIPGRKKIMIWIIALSVIVLLLSLALWIREKRQSKNKFKVYRETLRQGLMGCTSYDEIVFLWRNKKEYLTAFPRIENNFKVFEETLFKYQFKFSRSEKEVEEVIEAYKKFKASIMGSINEA